MRVTIVCRIEYAKTARICPVPKTRNSKKRLLSFEKERANFSFITGE